MHLNFSFFIFIYLLFNFIENLDKVISPFKGTIFVNSDIITSKDKNDIRQNEYYETALRKMYDRSISIG